MHIVQLLPPIEYYSPVSGGAIATVAMQHSRHLLQLGHRVTVLAPDTSDPVYDAGSFVPLKPATRQTLNFFRRRLSGLRKKIYRWDWPYYEHYLRSFRKAIKSLAAPPEVVIVHNDLVSPAHVKRAVADTRVVAWLHNEIRTDQKNALASSVAVDQFVAVSDYINSWTRDEHGFEGGKLTTVLNGVDLGAFFPERGFLTPRPLGEPLRVLFVGRLDPNKGPDLAADAVSALRAEGLPVSLTVAGGLWFYGNEGQEADSFFRALKQKMDAAGANHVGYVTRAGIPALIRSHDVVCLLARSNDPCPLVALEAMASGCAVLASNRGGLPQATGGAALMVDPDDNRAIADALRSFATCSVTLRLYKERSVQHAAAADWSRRTLQLERLLKIDERAAHDGAVLNHLPSSVASNSDRIAG
ncbi:MAG TPA: glycosyltransferase family 4 protein [Tepidisphaeraceae bacterium]|nr:glycosyltransferase family 4 protein [Tepidisphaeraceae bacterium]